MLVNTLGNLVLVVDTEKIVWEDFDKKKARFAKSSFTYTKDVANYPTATSKQIQARAKKLANLAVRVWSLPEKYNEKIKSLENVHNFDYDDFEIFKGKKPSIISIMNTEKKVTTWKALVFEVVKQLYSLDAAIFRATIQRDAVKKYFSTAAENLRVPEKIDDDVYIECNFDTKNLLRMAARVVENFDDISGMDIKNEIWFTLK